MTTAEVWRTTDRLLPLGEAADGAWIAEQAVQELLLTAAQGVRGVVPARPRFRLAEPGPDAGIPVPPGGLPPGDLRVSLEFAAVTGRPLPQLASRLRVALLDAAEGTLGLSVAEVNLRITDLLDAPPDSPPPVPPPGRTSPPTPDDPAALAALAVPGVAALTDAFGAPVVRTPTGLRVEVAVTKDHHPLTVTRALRTAVTAAAPEATTVTVVVSELR
ncbi:hypothetical protein ABZ135_04225 [Streptomyces sp. NPDC006339]|uniref:hypothetical protein n=1 Tax=Streptomyces sp. NPDC006339 TaxID=3156755 RepID=UPI00339F06D4